MVTLDVALEDGAASVESSMGAGIDVDISTRANVDVTLVAGDSIPYMTEADVDDAWESTD